MNKAFNGVFVEEDASIPTPVPQTTFQGLQISNVKIKREDVKRRLQELNVNKAPGPDSARTDCVTR